MYFKTQRSLVLLLGFLVFGVPFLAHAQDSGKAKPNLFLLTEYQEFDNIQGWVMSEKLDGIRAYWNGQELLTRNGNPIYAPNWFIDGFPPFELDGELWLARNQYSTIQSIVLDKTPSADWQKITYQIFEVPNQSGDLIDRFEVLKTYLQKHANPYIKVIKQTPIKNHNQVQQTLKRVTSMGGEGLVIRNPYLPYVTGRQSGMQKVKLKQDAECQVVGYIGGKGKYKGEVGALRCEILDEQLERFFPGLNKNSGVIRIGSGLSDQQRKQPPKIGSIVTFQFMGLTKNSLPRFPVYIRER